MAEDPAVTYTPPEVAEMIGAKPATLRKWIREGLITPSIQEGEPGTPQVRYRFSPEDVEAAKAIHDEGGRAEASKQAMLHLPEAILAQLSAAVDHFRDEGEVIAVSETRVVRVRLKTPLGEYLDRLGPGPVVIVR